MKTERIEVDLRYSRKELNAIFAYARAKDVERSGRYDAPSAAINIWTHSWINLATRGESTLVGSFYFNWVENNIWMIEIEEGFSLEDLLKELGDLELQALGQKIHGR